MRIRQTLKNSSISIIAQLITVILAFSTRKVFIMYMDIENLGYESLFSNIFNLVSIAEMGISNIIVFNLYREFANKNFSEVGKWISIYKVLYRIVAFFIIIIGIMCIPFLNYLIKGDVNASWNYIISIYMLQLLGVVASYFLSYRRTIFIADQKEYKLVVCDLVGRVILQVFQIILLVLTRSFIIYLFSKIFFNIAINYIIFIIANKEYPYLKVKHKISFNEIKNKNMFRETRDFLVHKLANTVFSGTDNIVISSVLGIESVALYGNYYIVQNAILTLFLYKALNPLRAAIGNLVYSVDTDNKKKQLFYMFNMFGFMLAKFVAISFLVLYQPFITLWLGAEYLLPFTFVVTQSLAVYIQVNFEILYMYRSAFGDYFYDKKYMILSATINLVGSIVLVKYYGITGVMIGTVSGLLLIIWGRVTFVFGKFSEYSINIYIWKQLLYMFVFVLESVIVILITWTIPFNMIGLVIRAIICILVPNILSVIFFRKTEEMCMIFEYIAIIHKFTISNKIRVPSTKGD